MRAILFGALVVALCACKKDKPEKFDVQIGVSCWACKVYWSEGTILFGPDTVYGAIQAGDTVFGTRQWNVVIEEGQSIQATAYSLEITDLTPVTVSFSGDIPYMSATAVSPDWAILNYTPH